MMNKNISPEKIRERILYLVSELNEHNYHYYVENNPLISDQEFDKLLQELIDLENKYPEFAIPDSPSKKIGGIVADGFTPYEHISPMMSMDNIMNENEAADFDGRIKRSLESSDDIQFVGQPKFDGVSASITYKKGILAHAATRGDGKTGEEITNNIKTIGSIPLKLRNDLEPPQLIEIRGEVIYPIKSFNNLNKQLAKDGEPLFANPRNAASGALRQFDSGVTAKRPLDFYAWGTGHVTGRMFKKETEVVKRLEKWGFKVENKIETCRNIGEAISYHHRMEENRENFGYEVDGVVIKVDDIKLQGILGSTAKHPRWCVAFKFKPRQAVTVINGITVQVGRVGLLTPVAELEPVNIGGITVKRASLHTENIIKYKDIRVGDKVVVQRSGDVIPDVVKPIVEKRTGKEKIFTMPRHCPVCNSAIERENVYIYCSNVSCSAQLKGKIQHLVSKSSFDIEGLGEKVVAQLVEKNLLTDLGSVFYLQKEDLTDLEGFADKSSGKLIENIRKSKNVNFERFINSLSIKHIGWSAAQLLAQNFSGWEELKNASYKQLTALRGIGHEMAESIINFFKNEKNIQIINKILESGVCIDNDRKNIIGNSLQSLTFVITGTLENHSRDAVKILIEKNGGKVVSSISGKTDYVLYGENPGSKLDRANRLGIKTINQEELNELLKS